MRAGATGRLGRMTELPPDCFNRPLADVDPEVADAVGSSSSASSARSR